MKTVLKRMLVLTWVLMLLGLLAGCQIGLETQYELAQQYMGMRDYAQAAEIFASLGGYQDSERCVLYCLALEALDANEFSRAGQDFFNLEEFKLSPLYYDYVTARQLEVEGSLYEAQEGYLLLGSFLDASQRGAALSAAIPDKEYTAAKTLYEIGEYEKALAAFLSLDSYRDSAAMAKLCTDAIGEKNLLKIENVLIAQKYEDGFAQLDSFLEKASPLLNRDAQTLKAKYQAILYDKAAKESNITAKKALYGYIASYKDVADKLKALDTAFPPSINALNDASQDIYASFGGLLYRVMENKDGRASLLCETILDIMPVNVEGEIYAGYEQSSLRTYLNGPFVKALSQDEQAAVISVTLPDVALARALSVTARMAAVPEGLKGKNPLVSSLGNGCWWLFDAGSLVNSQMIVYYNGVIYEKGLPATDLRTGVRPLITLDTARFPFKSGTGTREDPLK